MTDLYVDFVDVDYQIEIHSNLIIFNRVDAIMNKEHYIRKMFVND